MSSSDTPINSLTKAAGNVVSWAMWLGKKSVLGPVSLGATGTMATAKWFFYSTCRRCHVAGNLHVHEIALHKNGAP
jgi:hypothetical protein